MDLDALFFDNGEFAAPLHVRNIDDVPVEFQDWYFPFKSGNQSFRLKADIWKTVREPFEAQVRDLMRRHETTKAQLDAEIASNRKRHEDERASEVLANLLKAAGVKEPLVRGAVAVLKADHAFTVETDIDGTVRAFAQTDQGEVAADMAVERFLESEDGRGFASRKAATNDGRFTAQIVR